MIWQDIILTIGNIMFTVSLLPQVYHGFKIKRTTILFLTTILTVIGLFASATALFTLSLYFSAITMSINGTLWFLLLIQTIIYK